MVKNGILRGHEMTIADVGASGGFNRIWNVFGDQLRVIGFEPNEEQFKRLTSNNIIKYWKVGLGRIEEDRTIHITRFPYSSGEYMPDMNFWQRFPNAKGLEIVGTETIRTVPLDTFIEKNRIQKMDYIKLDTEGSELEILEGAIRTLEEIIAVEVEVAFIEYHMGRPLFADIDAFLRKRGFRLYHLETIKLARKSLIPIETDIYSSSNYGQTLAADALFMKDLVSKYMDQDVAIDAHHTIKAICMYEIFCQPDSAIELLELALERKILPKDFECCLDLLVPVTLGRYFSLQQYRNIAMSFPKRFL
jgi:FkbM family methyltransferase